MEICINEIVEHSKYEIPKNYEPIRKIGKGSFGRVIEVLEKTTKTKYAMKIINKDSKKIYKYDTVKDEVNILKNLSHPNIIKYYDFQETIIKLYIIMELAEGESLFEWIANNYKNNKTNNNNIDNDCNQIIDESKIYIIIKQLLLAINYLHSHNICHRDIKPQNILLHKKGEINNIKLIDFGLSVKNFQNIGENKICGTWAYMSPEMLFNHKYYKPIDLWAVGIIMYQLLNNGEHPFYKLGMTKKELLKNIKNKNIPYINNISPLANNLLQQLLQKDLSLRITASLALKHPWITRNESDPIPLNLYEEVNKIIIKNKIINLFLISSFMNYMSKKWSKYKIIHNIQHTKSNKCNTNCFKHKNFRQKLIYNLDLTTKYTPCYKSISSQQVNKYKIISNLKHFSYNIMEINKNGNMENSSIYFRNKIKIKENHDSSLSRNKKNFLPKIQNNRTAEKKISKSKNYSIEKFNCLQYNIEECKKKLFRNNSNWGKRNTDFGSYLKSSKQNNNRYYQ